MYHGFGDCTTDELSKVDPVPSMFTAQARVQILSYSLGEDVMRYGVTEFKEQDFPVRMMWLLRFYGTRDFVGVAG